MPRCRFFSPEAQKHPGARFWPLAYVILYYRTFVLDKYVFTYGTYVYSMSFFETIRTYWMYRQHTELRTVAT